VSTFFGSDTVCISDLSLIDTQTSDPIQVIGQRIARRLQTTRGALALIGDDPDFGFDVRQFVNGKFNPRDRNSIESLIAAEILKDEQVASATVSFSVVAGVATVSAQIGSSAGPFELTLNVGDLTTDLVFSAQVAA
jgi:hypothetical protein